MNHNRSTALERSVKKLLGGLNRLYGYPTSPSASIMAQNIQLFGPRGGFLTHQLTKFSHFGDSADIRRITPHSYYGFAHRRTGQ